MVAPSLWPNRIGGARRVDAEGVLVREHDQARASAGQLDLKLDWAIGALDQHSLQHALPTPQLPMKFGLRLAWKASTPSRKSSDERSRL
jgi:hypothetical protein